MASNGDGLSLTDGELCIESCPQCQALTDKHRYMDSILFVFGRKWMRTKGIGHPLWTQSKMGVIAGSVMVLTSLNRKLTWGESRGHTMAAFSGHREDGDELLGFCFSFLSHFPFFSLLPCPSLISSPLLLLAPRMFASLLNCFHKPDTKACSDVCYPLNTVQLTSPSLWKHWH
ncbi:hypothetical protein GOODEAATRI_009769 [Goodea atripinnis]|uniref:Uncharacterized protein n=1 Tax=Goodea atripinnis TaxID=208336 RepID=A0ABV0PMF5_9TELE